MKNAHWKHELTKLRVVMIEDIVHGARFNQERNFVCFDELEALIASALCTQQAEIAQEIQAVVNPYAGGEEQRREQVAFEQCRALLLSHFHPSSPQAQADMTASSAPPLG